MKKIEVNEKGRISKTTGISEKVLDTDQLGKKKVSRCVTVCPQGSLLWEVCVKPPGTTKAGPRGEGLRSVPAQRPLSPVSETHDVFSNMDLPSTSGRQPRALVTACSVLGLSWTILTNPKEGFS